MANVQFDYSPDLGASKEVTPRINVVRFGDGYIQRGANGINVFPQKWSVSFSTRSDAEALTIESLFQQASGGTLLWKPPSPTIATDPYLRWVVTKWNRVHPAPGVSGVSAQFEQVFEP